MSPILALSLTGKIEQYGAYAGLASVLGLAVLSLLYFAQAREVKRLREWAGRAPERAAELQDRVQADAQRRVVAQPQAQPRPAVPAAGPVQPGAAPPRPATPAAAAATAAGQAAPGAAAAAAATAAGATATSPAVPAGPAGQPTTVQPAASPAPNGGPPASPPPGQPLRVPPVATPPSRAGGPAAPPPGDDGPGRSWLPIVGTIAGLLVLGVIVVFVVLGGGDGSGRQRTTHKPATTPQAGTGLAGSGNGSSTTPVKPNAFTTAVLNGTTVPGLARGVAVRLQNANFKTGTITNAADQSHSATIVEYAPGRRREAAAVAKAIDVAPDAVQQLSPGSRTIAGQEALVVVTVGNDQNQSPQQQP